MDKLFSRFRKSKKANKENLDILDQYQSRHVNFRESSAPARSNGNAGRKNYCYSDSEDDDSSEVTIKVRNPYHVITAPKRNKGPRSCPGGGVDDERHGSLRGGRDDHDRSFQSEFISSRQSDHLIDSNKQLRRRYHNIDHKYQNAEQPLRDASNRAANGKRDRLARGGYSKNGQVDEQEEQEMDRAWTADRMAKYEQKCHRLTECLQLAINNERQAKSRKKYYQQLYEDAARKNMKLQTELESLRTVVYGLETELHRNRMLIAQREDCLSLMDPLYHQTSSSSKSHHQYPRLLNANPPSHLGSLFSNTATPSSMNGGGGMNAGGSLRGGSIPRQFLPHSADGNGQQHTDNNMPGGGSGESLAQLSSSSLGLNFTTSGTALTSGHRLPGPVSIITNPGAQGKHRIADNAFTISPSRFAMLNSNGQESDEIKNFRSQHIDSFSGSSRPGTGDREMEKIKLELCSASLSSRTTTRVHSDTSSPEIARCQPGMHISASCLGISFLHNGNADASFSSQVTLREDDGYATSETNSMRRAPPAVIEPVSESLLQLKRSASLS